MNKINFYFILMLVPLLVPLAQQAQPPGFEKALEHIDTYLHTRPDTAKYLLGKWTNPQSPPLGPGPSMQVYNRLGQYYMHKQEYGLAQGAFRRSLRHARQAGDPKGEHVQCGHLANAYNQLSNYDSALYYYDKAIRYFQETSDSIPLASNLSNKASAFIAMGQYVQALEHLFRAEKIYKKQQHTTLGTTYENIAVINAALGYDSLVAMYTRKAINVYENLGNKVYLATAYGDLAVAYKNISLHDSALYYFKLSISLAETLKDENLLAKNHLNLGNLYDEKGQRSMAMSHYKKSLRLCEAAQILYGTYLNHINIGQLYLQDSLCAKSLGHLEKAHGLLPRIPPPNNRVALYNSFYLACKCAGNTRKALFFLEKVLAGKDSMAQAQKHQELMELQTKYANAKKQAQIEKLEKEYQQGLVTRNTLAGGILVLLLLIISVSIYVNKQRQVGRQKALLAKKEIRQAQKQLAQKREEAVNYSMQNASFNGFLKTLHAYLLKVPVPANSNNEMAEALKLLADREKEGMDWEDFDQRFKEANKDFINILTKTYPSLTQTETRICTLLWLGLKTKEIALLMNRSMRTIENFRYRIRKKTNIEPDTELAAFLQSL